MGATRPIRFYLAVYLVSTASLTYEIGLTRLFSLAQGYHFAFLVISIALLGIGAGGTLLAAGGGHWRDLSGRLSFLSSLYALTTLLAYLAANRFLFDPVKAAWSSFELAKIFVQYLLLSLPFALAGMIVIAAIRGLPKRVRRIYLADMAGAATGCLLILVILTRTGGEGAVKTAALLGLAAALLFGLPSSLRGKAAALLPALAVLIIILGFPVALKVNISPYRPLPAALSFPGGRLAGTLYSPSGQLDIVDSPAVRAAPGLSLNYEAPLPPQRGFTLNGGALSTVTGRAGDLTFLRHLPSALPYRLRPGAEVYVADPAGGMELITALENDALSVTGSERNGAVVAAMRGPLAPFSGNLYADLNIAHGAARHLLKESAGRYDVISLPLTDTLGGGSSGMHGLQEDYALTVEAMAAYLGGLKEGGYLAASLYLLPPPRVELKLLETATAALEQRGATAADRIMAIRSWGVLVVLVSKRAIPEEDILVLRRFCEAEGFDLVWYPGMREEEANRYNRFERPLYHGAFRRILDPAKREAYLSEYLFNVEAATDDRPFFGQTFRFTRMRETFESVGRKWGILIEGGYLLPWVLLQSAAASLLLILVPYLIFRKRGGAKVQVPAVIIYFAAIGAGFMFLEIALIQRLIPSLGEGVYALSAVLFSLLVSTAAGSGLAEVLKLGEKGSGRCLLLLPPLILCYALITGTASEMLAVLAPPFRYALLFAGLLPLGMAMGIPFPSGMARLQEERLIPLAWCVNGCVSVVASTAAMMTAAAVGFSGLFVIAALSYAAAFAAYGRLRG